MSIPSSNATDKPIKFTFSNNFKLDLSIHKNKINKIIKQTKYERIVLEFISFRFVKCLFPYNSAWIPKCYRIIRDTLCNN